MPKGHYDRATSARVKAAWHCWVCLVCGTPRRMYQSTANALTERSGPPKYCSIRCAGAGRSLPGRHVFLALGYEARP